MKKLIAILCAASSWGLCFGQTTDDTKTKIPTISHVEVLGDAVNSVSAELNPIYVDDLNTLFLNRRFYIMNKFGPNDSDDIWFSKFENGQWQKAKDLESPINNAHPNYVCHIGLPTASYENYVLVIGNNYGHKKRAKKGAVLTYRTSENGVSWSNENDITIANVSTLGDRTDCYLTEDRKALIISMTRANGQGERDLYVCLAVSNYTFGDPINLGNTINTAKDECTPFLTADLQTLYFASNGIKDSYGGHDIYAAERKGEGWTEWKTPVNLGSKINGSHTDEGFRITKEGDRAFFTKGVSHSNSDVAQAVFADRPSILLVKGRLVTADSGDPVYGRIVVTQSNSNDWVAMMESNPQTGEFDIDLPPDIYSFQASSINGNQGIATMVDLSNVFLKHYEVKDIKIPLSKESVAAQSKVTKPISNDNQAQATSDISNAIRVTSDDNEKINFSSLDKPIASPGTTNTVHYVFFTPNEIAIESQYFERLNHIADLVFANASRKVFVDGHTDSSGSHEQNLAISKRRAQAVKGYLMSRGLDEERIVVEYHGDKVMLDKSGTPEGNRKNRRVELRVKG